MMFVEHIQIELGDIAEATTEAVVNAANNELWMGSGVAGALKRAGGVVIEQEAVKQGPINIGEAVITTAGSLPSLYVIHAAAMGSGRPATEGAVYAATLATLKLAVEKGIDSISLPALGTGVGGLSLAQCAVQMISATKNHWHEHESPTDIRFVLFGQNAVNAFNEAVID